MYFPVRMLLLFFNDTFSLLLSFFDIYTSVTFFSVVYDFGIMFKKSVLGLHAQILDLKTLDCKTQMCKTAFIAILGYIWPEAAGWKLLKTNCYENMFIFFPLIISFSLSKLFNYFEQL